MKYFLLVLLVLLRFTGVNAQNGFSVQAVISPKMSINNNTSATVAYRAFLPDNEADARSALGYSYDYSLSVSYSINKHRFSAGIGRFDVRQMFRPSFTVFGPGYKNIQKSYYFLQIPVDYEREIYHSNRWKFFAGTGITIVTDVYSDIFKPRGEWEGYMYKTDGSIDQNMKYYYGGNHLNMETFNLLVNASVRASYQLNKHFSLLGGLGMKQGFRPLMTSVMYFERTHPSGNTTLSHVTSVNNGQCILLNLGIRFSF